MALGCGLKPLGRQMVKLTEKVTFRGGCSTQKIEYLILQRVYFVKYRDFVKIILIILKQSSQGKIAILQN